MAKHPIQFNEDRTLEEDSINNLNFLARIMKILEQALQMIDNHRIIANEDKGTY